MDVFVMSELYHFVSPEAMFDTEASVVRLLIENDLAFMKRPIIVDVLPKYLEMVYNVFHVVKVRSNNRRLFTYDSEIAEARALIESYEKAHGPVDMCLKEGLDFWLEWGRPAVLALARQHTNHYRANIFDQSTQAFAAPSLEVLSNLLESSRFDGPITEEISRVCYSRHGVEYFADARYPARPAVLPQSSPPVSYAVQPHVQPQAQSQPQSQPQAPPTLQTTFTMGGGCVAYDTHLMLADGSSITACELAKSLRNGIYVATIDGPARVVGYLHTIYSGNLVQLEENARITPWHPVVLDKSWHFPASGVGTVFEQRWVSDTSVFSFMLEKYSEPKDCIFGVTRPATMLTKGGVAVATLAHGIVDESIDVIGSKFWGSTKLWGPKLMKRLVVNTSFFVSVFSCDFCVFCCRPSL